MDDSVMYTWDVYSRQSHGYQIVFRCARKETAEYLRDWCEAERWNDYFNTISRLQQKGVHLNDMRIASPVSGQYSISESEVIL